MDLDFLGEKICKIILEVVFGCKYVFLLKYFVKFKNKWGIGVEYVLIESIRVCLENVYEEMEVQLSDILVEDLIYVGLIGGFVVKC